MDFLEFADSMCEVRGAMIPGRLKFTDSHIVFKNSKTGKVEQILANDIDVVTWQKFAGHWGIRVFNKNGNLHRFGGFKESDKEKLAKFFTNRYDNSMLEKELSYKGWNWGTAKFSGSVLSFDVSNTLGFEVPLHYTSQCTTGKNEVTLEFHPNDDAPVSLMELRFHIPASELAGDDPVEAFKEQVLNKASIISATGDAIAIFREIPCLTPRGRYDIKVFSTFFQLHGKTFDYKIPMSTVLRLFLLPHKDGRQMFFVASLDPPIKQGQTRYHYLVFLFAQEEEVSIELPFSEEEVKEKFGGKLAKEMNGPMYDVVSKIMKVLVNRKLTVPAQFIGNSGTPAVSCSYKAAAGYMYPLERGFIFVHKPPLHIRFEEITSVNFARSGGSTRSFDFEVETKSGIVHTFSSIEKEEYPKLFDFITTKKLRVKNRGKTDKPSFAGGDFDDSDAEGEPDAYLARVKAEAQERVEDDSSDEGSEEDEDFNPNLEESDVAEEFDSNASSSSDSEGGGAGSGGSESKTKKKKKERPAKKEKRVKETKKKGEKSGGGGKEKESSTKKKETTTKMKEKSIKKEKVEEVGGPKKSYGAGGGFKSKEFISESSSDSS